MLNKEQIIDEFTQGHCSIRLYSGNWYRYMDGKVKFLSTVGSWLNSCCGSSIELLLRDDPIVDYKIFNRSSRYVD